MTNPETCGICGCKLHRTARTYARHNIAGRSHATAHHFVAERFFGRSSTRKGTKTEGIFATWPWNVEGPAGLFCYECHEDLLHNPVLLPDDVAAFAMLVHLRGLDESEKSDSREKLAGRIQLFHEIISRGLKGALADADGVGRNHVPS